MFGHDDTDNQIQSPADPVVQPTPSQDPQNSLDSAINSMAASTPLSANDAPAGSAPVVDDNLLDIKQQALQQLSPLVGHLEQTPEEKFRTTMMMIQASDDQSLIKPAYEAAQQIPDEKARAQALLDVVNEINYFTQQHQQ